MTQAVDKLGARRRRISQIRRTVAALSLAIFIALFAGLYVQMAAGRDPVLGSQTVAASSGSSAGSSSSSADSGSSTSSDTGASASTTAVTTSQS
jgi:hypothetical protein